MKPVILIAIATAFIGVEVILVLDTDVTGEVHYKIDFSRETRSVKSPNQEESSDIPPKASRRQTAKAWLADERNEGRKYDQAREVIAERLATSNPLHAINLAIDISNPETSEKSIIKAARELYQQDPETVIQWLSESGLSEESRLAILPSEVTSQN